MRYSNFIALFILGIFMANCQQNNVNPTNTPAAGTWKVSYFFDKTDETPSYSGYTFEFAADGTLTATAASGQGYIGTWKTNVDDSKDKFVIDFNGTVPSALEDLEEDWIIESMSDSLMHFTHGSDGNGNPDVLKFVK